MIKAIWNNIFVETFNKFEAEKSTSKQIDTKAITIFIVVAFSLVFIQYLGSYSFWGNSLDNIKTIFPNARLFQLTYWVSVLIVSYLIIPIIVIKLFFKENLKNYGLSPKGFFKGYRLYLVFFIFMVPLILLASTTEGFQYKYPFYNPNEESLWPNFIIWQFLYLLQFFALEFFFRGFMIHGLKKQFGFYSIFIMMIPYVMIHFSKPMPETIGAIFAGIILGTLSLKSRSIWLGVAIHYSVAITMDLAALWQKGYFD